MLHTKIIKITYSYNIIKIEKNKNCFNVVILHIHLYSKSVKSIVIEKISNNKKIYLIDVQ